MKYDFETILNRLGTGSNKWEELRKYNISSNEGIVPLSNAEMEFKNAPEIIEGLKSYLDSSVLAYFAPLDGYYEAVISWMERRHSWKIKRDWIVPYTGVHTSLCTLLKAFSEENDGVILMQPTWAGFFHVLKVNNRKAVDNPLIHNGDSYEIDFVDLERKARDPKNKILFLCSPQNPVGRVWKPQELERVAKICIDNNVLIVSDELHSDLIMPGYKHTVMASLTPEISDHVITCTAPSKTFNLAGMQISNFIISNPEFRERLQVQKSIDGILRPNMLAFKACELAYTKCGQWLDECITVIDQNREYISKYVKEKMPQLKVVKGEGSYLLWLDCRSLGLDYMELERRLKEEAHLFFDDGYYFGDEGQGFERINIACPTKVIEDAMDRLYCWVKTLQQI